jgi:hypothetical protein
MAGRLKLKMKVVNIILTIILTMYCPALYIRPDLLSEGWPIKFERYRTLITFISPRKIKCTEEILLHNLGASTCNIVYDIEQFKQQLYVFDSNGRNLEFYGYASCSNQQTGLLIKIEFPRDDPLNYNDYRTISLHYYIEPSTLSRYRAQYSIPLDIAESFFIHFEKPKEYHISLRFFKEIDGKLECITRSDKQLDFKKTDLNVQISGHKLEGVKNLFVIVEPDLHPETKIWFMVGSYFGWVSAVIILTELLVITGTINVLNTKLGLGQIIKMQNVPNVQNMSFLGYVPTIIPLSVAAITSLVVIKGWIFTKDMDWILNDINNTKKNLFTEDRIYIALIGILTFEIAITISICILTAFR